MPGAWWEHGDFALDHTSAGWQLTHPRYPSGADEVIPVDGYPPGAARLRRTILAAQAASATVITGLTGRLVGVWEEDEDGVGEPYWTAQLAQDTARGAIEQCFRGSGHGFEPFDYPANLDTVQDTDLWIVAWHGDEVVGLVINERQADGTVDCPGWPSGRHLASR